MVKSPKFSFKGWDILVFLKGRKKTLVTVIGAFLAYFILDDATNAIVAGAIVEATFAVAEYYIKER